MEKKLPKNWVETELGSIVKVINGYAFKSSDYNDEGIPIIRMSDIAENRISTKKAARVQEKDAFDRFIIEKGDILLGLSGSIGKFGIFDLDDKVYLNQRVGNIRLISDIYTSKKFIYYFIGVIQEQLLQSGYGGAIPNISSKDVENFKIPLPPLPEQERIVAKLDLLFAQNEKMKTSLEKIPQLLKDFRQQILSQAVTGKLINPKFIGKLEDYEIKIITGPFGSSLHKSDYVNAGIPVINPSHILNGEIVPDERVTIDSQTFHKLSAWKLVKGDVILGRRGEMGRAAPFSGSTEMLCGTGSIILRSDKVNSQFLAYYLRSELCVKYLNENSVGSTMVNLNQGILKSLPIPIYTIKEQNEIVKKVEKLFLKSEIILNKYQKLKEKIDQFPQTILHKAFKGELVPQLPTDGDAKDLLKEILEMKKVRKKK